jgi:perosamine synthetase
MTQTLTREQTSLSSIPITRPVFDDQDKQAVCSVLDSGWIVQGPQVARFEQLFAGFVGSKHAIATTSCTTALHLALLAAGIGAGDEVLIPAFTFVATANAVEYVGARPILIDIDLNTFNISTVKLREYLEESERSGLSNLKAIMPVSLFGLPASMDEINQLAREYGLIVIEDAACGLGGYREGHHAGTEALAGCFSFHPRKAITTGEGGMLVTDDDTLANCARKLRDHGASKTDLERHLKQGGSLLPEYDALGFNYRMTDLQGALGVAQMAKAKSILIARRKGAETYQQLLKATPQLRPPTVPNGFTHGYQSFVCLFQPDTTWPCDPEFGDWQRIEKGNRLRNQLMAFMESRQISVRQGTHAVHTLGFYRDKYGFNDRDFPSAYVADRLSITLPLYSGITPLDQLRVVDTASDFLSSI